MFWIFSQMLSHAITDQQTTKSQFSVQFPFTYLSIFLRTSFLWYGLKCLFLGPTEDRPQMVIRHSRTLFPPLGRVSDRLSCLSVYGSGYQSCQSYTYQQLFGYFDWISTQTGIAV